MYRVNEKKPSKKVRDVLDECSFNHFLITGALYASYLFCVMVYLMYPILAFTMFQMKEPWVHVFVPGIDFNTKEGFVIYSIYHLVVLYMAGLVFGFYDALSFNLIFNVFTMSELQSNQLSLLGEELSKVKPPKPIICSRLSNFFLMILEMEK